MRISVILAHPQEGSFNHAIALTTVDQLRRNGHEIRYHDLYKEEFDPILNSAEIPKKSELPDAISSHCREIAEAEGIVIIHPNWWGQPPAMLKGWIDRVLRPGVAYEFLDNDMGEGIPKGLLGATSALVFNTSNTETERERTAFGDPLEMIWKNCIFKLCGVNNVRRRMFNIIVTSSPEQRKAWLEEARKLVDTTFPPV